MTVRSCALIGLLCCLLVPAAKAADTVTLPESVAGVLQRHCVGCHGADFSEAEVRLDAIGSLPTDARLALLNRVQDQLFFGMMPPEDEERLSETEHELLAGWVRDELRRFNASTLDEKLRYPDYGNYVDHETLFSGQGHYAAFTPARRWLVSPQIFHERVMDVFGLEGGERNAYRTRQFYGVTNPIVLTDRTGVRYYDLTILDGGHLLVMLNNARWIAEKQLFAAEHHGQDRRKIVFANPKDNWFPATTPAAFEAIILKGSEPTDEEIAAAIRTQFNLALRRPPTDPEVADYLELTRSAMKLGGTVDGLRQMLIAVLLESEFLYRLEFGAGAEDEHGRKKLSPHEAAFAISYALGDRGPDATLLKAAEEGRLLTKEDYHREVTRLLDDKEYYSGQVDPTLYGPHYSSNVTSHPKIVRFFREFFGYPGAIKVFKDLKRSGGVYRNPDRGTQGTPGRLVLETDRIVTMYVEQDQDVFKNLLTSDQFFVYHHKDNETNQQIIDEWRAVYERLKDTDWRNNADEVAQEHLDFLKQQKSIQLFDQNPGATLINYMHYFEESFGRGRTPFTMVPWAHGYYFHHSPIYNLPPTPAVGRYGSWKNAKYMANLKEIEFWDYPTYQPFAMEHRKGVLTHPSWLIAHSHNFHTDPIRRGRWIREKLLAGLVPDVPITVDAQVPEDHHKTFRERVELVTQAQECWKCHRQMNPLGLPFEMYDDFGRYRTEESLEAPENVIQAGPGNEADIYKTAPVVTTGALKGTGDSALDGEVGGALELIDRLAQSDRVRQSIIRYAFRYYMGRNEMLSDAQTLFEADQAYLKSGGSFKAVIVSLLTSDSFMYRKTLKDS
jgi:hypothetical protein